MTAMKPLLVLAALFILMCPAVSGAEPNPAERYNEANRLYRDGRFAESLRIYEKLIREGIKNPDLYYNASNAAYRSDSLGKAVLYLERALRLSPSDRDALANLAYLNSIKLDREVGHSNIVLRFLSDRYNAINVNTAALWAGFAFAAGMLAATIALFARNWKRLASVLAASLCGLVFLVSSAITVQKIHHLSTTTEGIIMVKEAPAYSGPGTGNAHIFTLHEGTKVTIERTQDSWNLVRLNSGAGGWIKAEMMEKI